MSEAAPVVLDEMELDALTELINISVSRAAANLRAMVSREVLLSVPGVALATRKEAVRAIGEQSQIRLVAVRQSFEGDLTGHAMLIFPEANSLEVVRAVTGGLLPADDMVTLEHEALAETGNVILNSCLSTIANLLQRGLRMSLPEILRGGGADLFGDPDGGNADDVVLLIYINFSVNDWQIKGYLAMVMDLPALQALKELLGGLIRRMTEGPTAADHVGR